MRYGYFDDEKREYIIERPDVPVSWTNYIGVKNLCVILSQNAGGYSFFKSAEHQRITRFRQNGVPLDRPGHYLYIRDDSTGEYWSVSWQPTGKNLEEAKYSCRHGLSYSVFSSEYTGIRAEQKIFVPVEDPIEIWDLLLKNDSGKPRRLSVFSYVEFSFHHIEIDNQNLQMSLYASGSSVRDGIIEYDFFYEPWTFHFMTGNFNPDSYDCLRDSFIGPYRSETNPIAVERGYCSGSSELGGNHCAALHKKLLMDPGEEIRLIFLLGPGNREEGRKAKTMFSDPSAVDEAFADLRQYWESKLSVFQCKTPHAGLDSMTNIWTLYQAETCIVWSRFASFVEVGGRTGIGYRDTSQDAMSVAHTNPGKVKQRLIELLQGQVSSGYGLHLFDPEIFKPKEDKLPGVRLPTVVPSPNPSDLIHGLEDVCSDDALWIIASVCEYVAETGDFRFLDMGIPFADLNMADRRKNNEEGEDIYESAGEIRGGRGILGATVYEHLKRSLDFSAEQVGSSGICRGLRADWNDCLNLGGGESAMVSFLHYWALLNFIEAAKYLRRRSDVEKYSAIAERVRMACEDKLWDGDWYLRGFTKKGREIGSKKNEEGKIFLESNSLAVLSELASAERARACMDSVEKYLYSKYGIHLLWPAFSCPDDDIGYVTRVYKGIKENAAIFSHPNPWAVVAECKLGRGDRAMKFFDALLPYNQNDSIEIREAEPYSYCQFVIGRDHSAFGRARHPWLTGSAGWAYHAATHWILGIRPSFGGLVVDPCIPGSWTGFEVFRRWRGADFHIDVKNPEGVEKGVRSITLNGKLMVGHIPPQPKGSKNQVSVVMGEKRT